MINLFREINKKINGIIWSFIGTGIVLLMLSVLVMWEVFILKLIISLFILLLSYTFIFVAYRLWSVKAEIEKYFKIK